MLKVEENIMVKHWKERMATLPKEKVEQIESSIENEQLVKLKPSKLMTKQGDIFVLSPVKGVYFYGKVFEANIQHIEKSSWYNGCNVVFVFACKSQEKDLLNYNADPKSILIGPKIISLDYWAKGLFETIGNIPLTEEEKQLDYGFFCMEPLDRWGFFQKANGEKLDYEPTLFSGYGINTLTGMYMSMKTELIINPDLLKF